MDLKSLTVRGTTFVPIAPACGCSCSGGGGGGSGDGAT